MGACRDYSIHMKNAPGDACWAPHHHMLAGSDLPGRRLPCAGDSHIEQHWLGCILNCQQPAAAKHLCCKWQWTNKDACVPAPSTRTSLVAAQQSISSPSALQGGCSADELRGWWLIAAPRLCPEPALAPLCHQISQQSNSCHAPLLQVAVELTNKDVIRAHARDELGIDIDELANPLQV